MFARIGECALECVHPAQGIVGARRGFGHQQPDLVIERRLVARFLREPDGTCQHCGGRKFAALQAGEQREQLAVVGFIGADERIRALRLAGTNQDGGLQLVPCRAVGLKIRAVLLQRGVRVSDVVLEQVAADHELAPLGALIPVALFPPQ